VEIARLAIAIPRLDPLVDARLRHFDSQKRSAEHRCGEWLRTAHSSKSGGDDESPCERAVEVLACYRAERFVGSLHDALRADVDPRAGCHLPVHDQSFTLELAKLVPRRPAADEIAVRNEHARRAAVSAQHTHGLAA